MREIAAYRDVTLSDLVTVIDSEQRIGTLASTIRVCLAFAAIVLSSTRPAIERDTCGPLRRSASASEASQAIGLSIESSGK
ncbi:MAG: hypothetical protein ABW318_04330 [Vicinamibacterales bacterium]